MLKGMTSFPCADLRRGSIIRDSIRAIWVVLKITSLLAIISLYYGTYYSGMPNWDPDFGNYRYRDSAGVQDCRLQFRV